MLTLIINRQWISKNKPGRLWPPSLNARMHWAERSRWTKVFKDAVWAKMNSAGNKAKIWEIVKNRKGKAEVMIQIFTNRPMDKDNSYTVCKPLLDALKGQAISDDNPEVLNLKVEQCRVGHLADQKIEINILN